MDTFLWMQGNLVAEDEAAPKAILYPRDSSLDPQLVWKGKDEQDREPLEVPAVPVYIQEKIHPQAIINALPRIEQPATISPTSLPISTAGRWTSRRRSSSTTTNRTGLTVS